MILVVFIGKRRTEGREEEAQATTIDANIMAWHACISST
jgi:hypothetical protein